MKFKSILSLYLYMYDYQYFQISGLTFIIDVDVLMSSAAKFFLLSHHLSPAQQTVPVAQGGCRKGILLRWRVAHLPRKLLPARLKTLPSENPWEDEEMLLIPSLLPNN